MRKLLLLLLPLVALVGTACGSADSYAAKVNATEISQDDLDDELQAILGNQSYLEGIEQQGAQVRGKGIGTFDTAFVARVLSRQVLLEIVHQELVSRNASPTQAELDEARRVVTEQVGGEEVVGKFPAAYVDTLVRRSAEVTRLQTMLMTSPVDEASIRRLYDQSLSEFTQTCVSHVLVSAVTADGRPDQQANVAQAEQLRAQAEKLRADIVGGADFAAVAAANSKDTSNKDQGGSLGCGAAGRFVTQFESAMATLAVGDVSQPVQTQFGFHLIKVTERRTATLQEATPLIRQRLLESSQEAFNDLIRGAVEKAKISVNPRYGRFEKTGESPGIIPPDSPHPPAASETGDGGSDTGEGEPVIPTQP